MNRSKSVTVNGVSYSSIADACERLNLCRSTVNFRLRAGYTVEQAFSQTSLQAIPITIDGITYESNRACCRAYGVDMSTVQSRLRAGMTLEDAITDTLHSRQFDINGKHYASLKQFCDDHQVAYHSIYSKLRELPLDDRVAWLTDYSNGDVVTRKLKLFFPVSIHEKVFESAYDASEEYHIPVSTMYARIKKGWTIEDAIVIPVSHRTGTTSRYIETTVEGVCYESISAACRAYGIRVYRVRDRMSRGASAEDAILSILRK